MKVLEPEITEARHDVLSYVSKLLARGVVLFFQVEHENRHGDVRIIGTYEGIQGKEVLNPNDLALLLTESMQDHANALGGTQTYWISAFRREDYHEPKRHFSFAGPGEEKSDWREQVDKVLTCQLMRHSEEMHRLAREAVVSMREVDSREKDRLYRELNDERNRSDTLRREMREFDLTKNEREIALLKAKREDRVHALMYDTLNLAAPTMLSKILPQHAGSGSEMLAGHKVAELLEDLSPKQIKEFIAKAGLDPIQLDTLRELREAFAAGKSPAMGEAMLERLLSGLKPHQADALLSVLRPEQKQLLDEIAQVYIAKQASQREESTSP